MALPLTAQVILAVEILLILAGCVLLWRHALRDEARAAFAARAAAMPSWPLSVPDFMLFLFCVMAGGVLLQSIVAVIIPPHGLETAPSIIINGGAFHAGMLAGVALFRLVLRREPLRPAFAADSGAWTRGLATLLIALPVLGATGLLWQTLMNSLGVELQEQDLIGIFAETKSPLLLGCMIVLAVVIAPVTEELIFRAGIFRYLRTRTPRWVALPAPALLFAALHGNLASFAPLMVLGMIFSLAYERTGTIAVPIIAHGLFNLNTIVLILAGLGV